MDDCFLKQQATREREAVLCKFRWVSRDGEEHKCMRDYPNHRGAHCCLCGVRRNVKFKVKEGP